MDTLKTPGRDSADRQPVVPSRMNPVREGANQFAELFQKMPAKRIGTLEDIAGAILYLCSQAGVSTSSIDSTLTQLIDTNLALQSYVDGHCLLVDGGRILLANGQ